MNLVMNYLFSLSIVITASVLVVSQAANGCCVTLEKKIVGVKHLNNASKMFIKQATLLLLYCYKPTYTK